MRAWPALALALTLVACERAEEPAQFGAGAPGEQQSISGVTQEGPVKATVELGPVAPRLGDLLTLTLTVEAQQGVTIEMPAFGEALGRFSIVDFTPRRQVDPGGATVESQRYTLQAPMSGRQRIPPLRIEFVDERPGRAADAGEAYRELLTEELTVEVASVLPTASVVDELKPPRPPLPELRGGFLARYWPWLLGGLLVIAGLAWTVVAWQRRALERVRITAYDRALRRLDQLERQGLPSAEVADAWYVELSDIVRRYIEDQYGVRAPELTTEEFLQEARRSAELSATHRELLSAFLERCDRVKFAAYSPEQSESREAFSLARRFLTETRIAAEPMPRLAA